MVHGSPDKMDWKSRLKIVFKRIRQKVGQIEKKIENRNHSFSSLLIPTDFEKYLPTVNVVIKYL